MSIISSKVGRDSTFSSSTFVDTSPSIADAGNAGACSILTTNTQMTTTWMSIEVRDGQWNHKSDHMRAGLARRSLQRASRNLTLTHFTSWIVASPSLVASSGSRILRRHKEHPERITTPNVTESLLFPTSAKSTLGEKSKKTL